MEKLHSLLKRQLRKCFGDEFAIPEEARQFIGMVDKAYRDFDGDRIMLERSLELSSHEMSEQREALRVKMAEVEKLNEFMMGREGRIIELKEEVNALLEELKREPKYGV